MIPFKHFWSLKGTDAIESFINVSVKSNLPFFKDPYTHHCSSNPIYYQIVAWRTYKPMDKRLQQKELFKEIYWTKLFHPKLGVMFFHFTLLFNVIWFSSTSSSVMFYDIPKYDSLLTGYDWIPLRSLKHGLITMTLIARTLAGALHQIGSLTMRFRS